MGAEISALADFSIIPPFEHENRIEKTGDARNYAVPPIMDLLFRLPALEKDFKVVLIDRA